MTCTLNVPFLDCNRGRRIYRAAMRTDVVGGHVELGIPHEETLFVYFLYFQPDVLPAEVYKRDTLVPCRFFWLTRAGVLRPAVIYARGDTMQSVAIAGYDVDGIQRHLLVHRLIAWTFLCPPTLYTSRWDEEVHCDHVDTDHGNNTLGNLRLWLGGGDGGHAQASALFGHSLF
jgi:hypothetical protein